MIETTLLTYLKSELPCPVVFERVSNKPPFVLIEKTGTSRGNRITTSTFALQSYGETMAKSADLNEAVKIAMDNFITLDEISASFLNSDYNFTNTATKEYRYQCVYDIVHI